MTVETGVFRRSVGLFPTGVVIVTSVQGDDHVALTANSFTSVSLDPPLVLICVAVSYTHLTLPTTPYV